MCCVTLGQAAQLGSKSPGVATACLSLESQSMISSEGACLDSVASKLAVRQVLESRENRTALGGVFSGCVQWVRVISQGDTWTSTAQAE